MKELPRSAKTLLIVVHLLGLACLYQAARFPRVHSAAPFWELALYGGLAVAAGSSKVRVTSHKTQKESGSLSLGFPIIFAALLRGGPLAGSAVAIVSCLSSCLYPRRQKTVQLLFNLSLTMVQSWVAGIEYFYLNGKTLALSPLLTMPAAACAGVAFFGINSAGVFGIISLIKGESPLKLWRQEALSAAPVHLVVAALIAVTAVVTGGRVVAVLLFGGLLSFLLYSNYAVNILLAVERQKHLEQVERDTAEIRDLNARLQRAMAETHHRVKNNLQVVVSLIELQMDKGDAITAEDLRHLAGHVQALAAIHDLLTYKTKSTEYEHADSLSARQALDRLMPLLRQTAGDRRLDYEADDVALPIGKGSSLAVLLNELVSNALKHGRGDIHVSLAFADGSGRLEVADHGPGFPVGFDAPIAAHTGLELVESLSRSDLQGETHYENRSGGGARVVVTFPLAVI